MQPAENVKRLFDAFSHVAAQAFTQPRLVSCHVLSKAPHYDDILHRFLVGAPIRPVSRSQVVEFFLRHYCINAAHLFCLVLGKIALYFSRWRIPRELAGHDGKTLVIDTFLVLPKVKEHMRYTDLYLPGLAETAKAKGFTPVYMFRLYGGRNPKILYQVFRILRDQGVQGVTELHLFTWLDWLALVKHWLVYPFMHWALVRNLAAAQAPEPEAYIRDALIHCLPQCYMIGEGRRLAGKRLAQKLPNDTRVVSWYENQTVNKAFHLGLFEAETLNGRHIPVIGAQLFTWPDNLLNNHADDAEVSLHLVPDSILVSGAYFLPEHSTQSYAVGPALRYRTLFDGEPFTPDFANPIIVLLSYHPEETARVLAFTRDAALSKLDFVYKFHPATKVNDYAHLLPAAPRLVEGSLRTVCKGASMVLGAGSGSLAEAVALGLPVVTVGNPSCIEGLGLNYLPRFGKGSLWEEVHSAADLPDVAAKLRQAVHEPDRKRQLAAFRNLLFAEPTEQRITEAFFS